MKQIKYFRNQPIGKLILYLIKIIKEIWNLLLLGIASAGNKDLEYREHPGKKNDRISHLVQI